MPSLYAKNTSVPVERSRSEIEATLKRYGCDAFAFGWSPDGAMIQFAYKGRSAKVTVPVPHERSESRRAQIERQRWRVLLLLIKAQLETVQIGLATFEEAFLPWMILEGGETVAQKMLPQLPAPAERPKLREVNAR